MRRMLVTEPYDVASGEVATPRTIKDEAFVLLESAGRGA